MKYCAELVYHQILHAIGFVIFYKMKLVLVNFFSLMLIAYSKRLQKGGFNNYVDRFLDFFDHPPTPHGPKR